MANLAAGDSDSEHAGSWVICEGAAAVGWGPATTALARDCMALASGLRTLFPGCTGFEGSLDVCTPV